MRLMVLGDAIRVNGFVGRQPIPSRADGVSVTGNRHQPFAAGQRGLRAAVRPG